MTKIYISPQVKILKSLYFMGGSGTSREIMIDSEIKDVNNVLANIKHLKNRYLIRRIRRTKRKSRQDASKFLYILRKQKLEKIKRMIKENYGDIITDEG